MSQRRAGSSRTPFWLWPAFGGVLAFGVALLSAVVHVVPSWLRWPGDGASAETLLQALATSAITVTGLTFTLTVVALQLASQQFSPRLLREFTRDRVIKAVLSVLVCTFVFTSTALRNLRSDQSVPDLTMLLASALGLASVAAVLAFLTHIARVLRIDTMMRAVNDEADRAISAFYPAYGDPRPDPPSAAPSAGRDRVALTASTSGFVRTIDVAVLVQTAHDTDVVIEIEARPGDLEVRGTPLASAWPGGGGELSPARVEEVVGRAVQIGYERSIDQDAAFGFRQLTDIAVKALSPAINDPVTAAHAVGHMADLLVKLTGRRFGELFTRTPAASAGSSCPIGTWATTSSWPAARSAATDGPSPSP